MNILLDTNIILSMVRAKDFATFKNFINPKDAVLYISIVSEAEIKSFAMRNKWGEKRMLLLNKVLSFMEIVDVNQLLVNSYAEIDSYSQRLNPNFGDYPFDTPRNMGKNDLWVAALASLLDLTLITTDADFDHLDRAFFEVKKLKYADFARFLN